MNSETSGIAEYRPSLLARLISFFSGTVGMICKLVFLCILNGAVVWAILVMFAEDKLTWAVTTLIVLIAIDFIYLVPHRYLPAKFMIPGSVFLVAYLIIPIGFTLNTAFQQYSTGHVLTKSEAIKTNLQQNLLQEGRFFTMSVASDASGEWVLVLKDDSTGETFIGRTSGLEPIPADSVDVDEAGAPVPPAGYTPVAKKDVAANEARLAAIVVPVDDVTSIRNEGFTTAAEFKPGLTYDDGSDMFVSTQDGTEYKANNRGSYVAADGTELSVGWRTYIGFTNFTSVINNPLVRAPFIRAFIWTVIFAASTVLISFFVGLFLAKTVNKKDLRFKRMYRAFMVVPYAIPGFLSLLVFRGLLNEDYGLINRILPGKIPWVFDPTWARVSVILVSVWLTAPYFFLVCTGALQAIPEDMVEAAKVDGANRWQVFQKVTMPMLLVVVTPLIIASFAYNFNNFNNIYLLTGGGPATNDQSVAGATDILISYTYKLAFESGKGQDYGLASAISIYIFFIVAALSASGFMRSKALENMR